MSYIEGIIITLILSGCGAGIGWLLADMKHQLELYEACLKAEAEDVKEYEEEE